MEWFNVSMILTVKIILHFLQIQSFIVNVRRDRPWPRRDVHQRICCLLNLPHCMPNLKLGD